MTDREPTTAATSPETQADATVAAVLMKNRGMTADEAVAEVLRLKSAAATSTGVNRSTGLDKIAQARVLIAQAIRLGGVTGTEAVEAAREGVSLGADELAADIREEAGLAR